jgi:hypothetical protein
MHDIPAIDIDGLAGDVAGVRGGEEDGDGPGDDEADGVEDGTYWYVLLLPNGIDHSGHLTIIR